MLSRRWICFFAAALAAGCTTSSSPQKDVAVADAKTVDSQHHVVPDSASVDALAAAKNLGTVYPTRGVINPDDPNYEGDGFSKQQVSEMFSRVKAENGPAYRAYKAAFNNADNLHYAFCGCGCALVSNHISAVDCFKDMHGFT